MPTPSLSRAAIVPFVLAVLLALPAAGVAGAKGDKGDRGEGRGRDRQEREAGQQQGPQETAPDGGGALLETIAGARVKMARTKVANSLTRIADPTGDQRFLDGSPASEAGPWSDIASVHMARIKVPGKLLGRMFEDFPRGAGGSFYGADADWAKGDRAVFVVVELAGQRPDEPVIQQVEVGLDGDGAGPLQAGAPADPRAGLERFSLSGTFRDGSESSGTTDVSGRLPGDAIEYYNAESGVFGFYDARRQAYFLIMPVDSDATSASVALRTVTSEGELIDRLELPDGGHFVSLDDAFSGWDPAAGPPLACRSIETLAAAGLEPGMTRIRYAAGVDPTLDSQESTAVLAALDAAGETVPVILRPVTGAGQAAADGQTAAGGESAADGQTAAEGRTAAAGGADEEAAAGNGAGSASTVDAALSRASGLGAFTLTLDAPPGTWQLEAADGQALRTPAGEPLIDVTSLVGSGGLRTGEGLEGFVAGDPGCARFALPDDVCTLVPADGMAGLVGLAASEVEQRAVRRPDGAAWCVGTAPATGEVQYIARFGTSYLTSEAFAAELATSACSSVPVDRGAEAAVLDCGAEGYERHLVRVRPESIADRDPDGGLLLSVDLLVDGSQPVGQRYDPAAGESVFGDLVAAVAASATPALSGVAREPSAAGVTE